MAPLRFLLFVLVFGLGTVPAVGRTLLLRPETGAVAQDIGATSDYLRMAGCS